ncbi:MAG: BA14K family protein [Pseudaminobacter sp.]|nr:BA14K family protein [Pseudaminobacter sp.]
MNPKHPSNLYAALIATCIVASPSIASPFEDLNRPTGQLDRPGITGCGRDRPCDWNPADRDPNAYRQPRTDFDLYVPIQPGAEPYVGRPSRLFPRDRPAPSHRDWCAERYRSYSARDDSFQPYDGPRTRCVSPYL